MSELEKLFHPSSVAVIGASRDPRKWGGSLLQHLIQSDSNAAIYPVNPNADVVQGLKAYPNLKSVGTQMDLVLLAVPAESVLDAIEDCSKNKAKYAIVYAGGFSETGKDGIEIERQMLEIAKIGRTRILGPNGNGFVSNDLGIIGIPVNISLKKGRVGLISQSGNLSVEIMKMLSDKGVGLGKYVGIGNQLDLTVTDFLEFFASDPSLDVIACYLEGVNDGERFYSVLRETTSKKPVVILKSARFEAGSRAARSHTGAIATSDKLFDAVLREAGACRVYSLDDMIEVVDLYLNCGVPKGKKIGIVTRGGGWGVLLSDACEENQLSIPELSNGALKALNEVLPARWSHGNPIDTVAAGSLESMAEGLTKCTKILLEREQFDIIIIVGLGVYDTNDEQEAIKSIAEMRKRYNKPIIFATHYVSGKSSELLKSVGGTTSSPEGVAKALRILLTYAEHLNDSRRV